MLIDALFLSTQISSPSGNTSSSLLLIDHLSGLFAMINNVCAEQFEIIRMVFPRYVCYDVLGSNRFDPSSYNQECCGEGYPVAHSADI
jgi:hypothetical protein